MEPKDWVKAQVVDIRDRSLPLPRSVVADANVLYIIHYDFTALDSAGGRLPTYSQNRHYPAWWKRATTEEVTLCTSASCLSEFVHLVERTELEILWRTDSSRPELAPDNPGQDFSPRYSKVVRYYYHQHLQAIREEVDTTLQSLKKNVRVLPQVGQDEQALDRTMRAWVVSSADFGDAALVAASKRAGISHIVSDDADLVSFDGIILYTANRKALEAAALAGKLISSES